MSGNLYIMRHGKTDWNEQHKLQGQTDVPLNDVGRAMAEEAAEMYRDVHLDICYCSPLIRARETAEILLKGRDIPIVFDDRLKEMCFGIYEGVEHALRIPGSPLRPLFKDPANYTVIPEGAESIDELNKRTGEFLKDKVYPLLEEGKDILIVGHGAMNSSIITQVRNKPRSDFWSEGIENCRLIPLLKGSDPINKI